MNKERFVYIDALRGIAIAGVIIVHSASITNVNGLLKQAASLGSMGVQLFFVISAFTIFYSLSKSNGSATQFRDFFIRRLFRIVPVYWLGIVLYTAVYGLGSRGWLDGPELWHYPFHILLINVLHPLTSSSVVPGGWSISCEVLFYMLVPLLYVYLNTSKKLIGFLLIAMVLLPVLNIMLQNYALVHWSGIDRVQLKDFFYRWIPNQLACFTFGILLYKIYEDKRYAGWVSGRVVNLIGVTLIVLALFALQLYYIKIPERIHLYSLVFMCLALLLSVVPWTLFVNGFTVFLGKISYSCYLIHFLVIKQVTVVIGNYFPVLTGHNKGYFLLVLFLSFLITIPLGWLSYTFIELQAVNLGRKLITYLNHTATHEKEMSDLKKSNVKGGKIANP
ncbi:acyltransferase family protein [Arcticibacter svalbardensis]|nr:acyltransferase [Arcticibacter svalbardensis]